MKFIVLLFMIVSLMLEAKSQNLELEDFKYEVAAIPQRGPQIEEIFQKLSMDLIRVQDSICSNRAHMWAYDLKRKFKLSPAKIFLFYTPKNSRIQNVSWWYHVAPILNVKGSYWVLDKGFPYWIKAPLTMKEWLKTFTGEKSVCKEIKASDTDLIERMFGPHIFPENTSHGRYDCYYKITPPGYWTPTSVAQNLLGKDRRGRPIQFSRDDFEENEVFESCMEAATTPLGWAWGTALHKCRYYLKAGIL